MKNFIFLSLIALLSATACKKSPTPAPAPGATGVTGQSGNTGTPPPTGTTGTPPPTGMTGPVIDTDVYVVGSSVSSMTGKYIAAYWKNGQIVPLSDDSKACFGRGITVGGGHVYVTGYYYDGVHNTSQAVYWLDGTEHTLGINGENAQPSGIGIKSNGVVYVAGTDQHNNQAAYWITDGTAIHLIPLPPGAGYSDLNGLYINGTDVYVAGSADGSAGYLKNSDYTPLTPTTVISNASAIAFDGTDVYTVGVISGANDQATIWKNNTPSNLTVDNNLYTYANAIAINGGNIYVVGSTNATATSINVSAYWKNGIPQTFAGGELTGIAVAGNDVYIIGDDGSGGYKVYWKNGTVHPLPQCNEAKGIVVVTHPH